MVVWLYSHRSLCGLRRGVPSHFRGQGYRVLAASVWNLRLADLASYISRFESTACDQKFYSYFENC
eukprot:6194650-Pleurochrysis_carterae.AAC.2